MNNTVTKTLANIVDDVRVCYDEIGQNDSSMIGSGDFVDQDESELVTIIKSKINEAIEFVYGNADASLLDSSEVSMYHKNATPSGDNVVTIQLDEELDDLLRVIWAKLGSWSYSLRDFLEEGDADASYVEDKYCGATWEKPAIVMSNDDVGRLMKMYRSKTRDERGEARDERGETVADATETVAAETVTIAYVKRYTLNESGNNTFGGRLYPAMLYYICGLVATTFGESSRAKEFMELAVSLMGAKVNN